MRQDEKAAMEQLIVSFQTGDRASLTRYLELWVKTESEIETIIGFSAPHLDPRSRPGTFGAMVMMRDKDLSDLMHKAAGMAAHYRQQMPWGKLHKRGAFEPSAPSAYNVVVAAGNAGPFTKNTMEVPMDPKKVKRVGQRRLYFSNIADARDRVFAKKMIVEFSPSPEVANRRIRWHRVARNDFLVLTEVIGRGMIKGGLNRGFGAYFKPLEEMLVELAALVLVFDPKNQEIGLVPTEESAKAIYDSYVSAMLEQLAEVGDSATLGQP
jgi:dipeptidyl-peptidase-3